MCWRTSLCSCLPLAFTLVISIWPAALSTEEGYIHRNECFQLEVKSAKHYRHLEGGYSRMEDEEGCAGRPVWRRPVSHLSPHIENLFIYSPPEAAGWVISHIRCDARAFAQTAVEALAPHDPRISGRWREAVNGGWPEEYSTMSVKCAVYDRDCTVGEWGEWGACSRPCGPGVRWRSRLQKITAQGLGLQCPPLLGSQRCLGRVACPPGWADGESPETVTKSVEVVEPVEKYEAFNPVNLTVDVVVDGEDEEEKEEEEEAEYLQPRPRENPHPSPRTDRVGSQHASPANSLHSLSDLWLFVAVTLGPRLVLSCSR